MFASKDLFFTNKSGGYQISRSVRLRSSASAYFNRTPASASNRTTWTWSGWVKRGTLGGGGTEQWFFSAYNTTIDAFLFVNDTLQLTLASAASTFVTTQVFRDPSAWYHIVLVMDTTQATASNRVKLYVNGSQVTAFSTTNYPAQNYQTWIDLNVLHEIGRRNNSSSYFDGYLTEINFIDGQALTPSSFGQTNTITGVWQPLKYTGTYGSNGFYLNFSDNSNNTATTIGKDYSGNGNNWTPNNISVTAGVTYDSMLDVPTLYADGGNGRGNYCVINPLQNGGTLTNGNLNLVGNSGSATGTVGITSGKWYWEVTDTTMGTGAYIGVSDETWFGTGSSWSYSQVWVYIGSGLKGGNGSTASYGASYTTGNVIGVALDMDAGTLTFYKDNTSQGTAFSTGISGKAMRPFLATASPSNTTLDANFGQRPFTYTPPTGFVALNTQNLPTPTISNGANYMSASLYSGTSASQSIVNSGNNTGAISFKPDLVWIKSRSAATDHKLTDSVRGVTKALISDATGAETTDANGLTAFNTNGFTIGSDSVYNNGTGPATYVAWQWKAGGTSSSNTSGSITSTVSVGATQGFSVVTYTGTGANATVGHGLGVAPKMVIVKERSAIRGWPVYHASLTSATYYVDLQTTAAQASAATIWNSTAPTSTVFSIGTDTATNQSTGTYVAYCFSEVAGFSKFGSYTGNGSADGPFVYCGFRPRWVLIKCSSTGGAGYEWELVDTSRNTSNVTNLVLYPNLSDAESTASTAILDITSNGFKLRGGANIINASSATYIFATFAENPFKNSLAR